MTGAHYQVGLGEQVLADLGVEAAKIYDAHPSSFRPSGGMFESIVAGVDSTYLGTVDSRCGGVELVLAVVVAAMGGLHERAVAADQSFGPPVSGPR